jgi:hypothetical protein
MSKPNRDKDLAAMEALRAHRDLITLEFDLICQVWRCKDIECEGSADPAEAILNGAKEIEDFAAWEKQCEAKRA